MKRLYFILFLTLCISSAQGSPLSFEKHVESADGPRNWAYEVGVSFITVNNINAFLGVDGAISFADGAAGGEIYALTASRRLGQYVWDFWGHRFTPQIELPFTLEIVDENQGKTFVAFAASYNVRWVDFPWNEYVKTSFSMGLGLNYSGDIYQIDRVRHPGEDRSNLKFNWPIQATFALPQYPDNQLTIYIAHHSGGHVFDRGGLNTLGVGLRRDF